MASSDDGEPGSTVPPARAAYSDLTSAVRDLVTVMRDGGISQLEVAQGDLKITLRAREAVPGIAPTGTTLPPVIYTDGSPAVGATPEPDGLRTVTSPMIGTFYASPAPGERPFVVAGERIEAGQTVAIIEAMKIMNEIVSEWSGLVEDVLVRDGEAVEYGHPLLRVRIDP